ncbi:MAG: hypothetical protein EOP87_22655, partial [Verrucomicrobiaceae bacterium]
MRRGKALMMRTTLLMLFLSAAASAAEPFTWENPLPFRYSEGQTEPRREVRDPCIIRVGDTWHLVFTLWPFRNREEHRLTEPDGGGSPGIAMYSSKDLKEWKFQNWLVKSADLPADCPYKHRFWAPEIHKLGGKFYLIFTADNWTNEAANPAGTWGAAGYAFAGVADAVNGPYRNITYIEGAACDTSLFEDAEGKTWAVIPRGNIDVQRIDLETMKLLEKPVTVVRQDNADIGIAARPEYLEGPWVERIGGKYHLFYAAFHKDQGFPDWLGYHTGAAMADKPEGPYRKDPRGRIFTGGHVAVFDGPDGRKWFSYRGETDNGTRGLLAVDPMDVTPDGRVETRAPTM